MAQHFFKWIFFGAFTALFGAGAATAADPISVAVSISPQQYFVQQIGNDRVRVHVMVSPGASPHTYEPRPRQMVELSAAQLYFAIGVEFEKAWLSRIAATNPHLTIIHTDHGIQKIPMLPHHHHHDDEDAHGHPAESHDHHDHGQTHHHDDHGATHAHQQGDDHDPDHQHHHHHDALDPHIWLSPPLVKLQARTILQALQAADPAHHNHYEANYRQFMAEIDALDQELRDVFAGKAGLEFMVFHPAWGYFAEAYGLKQVAVEVEGKDPKPAQLQELIEHARNSGIKVIFVQPQFSTKSAEVVAREIGGQVAFADPLAADWTANLRTVAQKFKAALE